MTDYNNNKQTDVLVNATLGRYTRKGTGWGTLTCMRSCMPFSEPDVVFQQTYAGNSLVNTGERVGIPFYDIPNPQLKAPPIFSSPDPMPVPFATPMATGYSTNTIENALPIDGSKPRFDR